MPRKLIKRYLPDHHTILTHKVIGCFGELIHDPNLWHLNRRSVSGAFAVGLFMAFIPVPFQMLLAAGAAIGLRVNLPLSVALVWVSNPLTAAPLFYCAYLVGTGILGVPAQPVEFSLSLHGLLQELTYIWRPFLLGCLVTGTSAAVVGYFTIRLVWRWIAVMHWKKRQQARSGRNQASTPPVKR